MVFIEIHYRSLFYLYFFTFIITFTVDKIYIILYILAF
nr:MAG TPA: hypothetical protein [Caudoviricetes sp.]